MDNSLDAQKSYKNLIWQDPDRMGGKPCFYGTRVPVAQLYMFLRQGGSVDEFVESFPTVTRELVDGVLSLGENAAIKELDAA